MTKEGRKTKAQLLEALRDREELYRGISESIPTSIVIVDQNGRVKDISPHHVAHFGRGKTGREDYIGKILPERPSVVAANLSQEYWDVLKGTPFRKEAVRFPQLSGGGEAYLDVSGVPLVRGGEVTGAVFIHQDVTGRTLAEQRQKESEERYKTVSELTSDYAYCFRVESDGSLLNEWVTGALDRVTGYSREELERAGGWERLIHPEDRTIPVEQLEALLSNRSKTVEYRIVTRQGATRWMLDRARPVWDSSENRVLKIEGAVRDITALKAAEQERLDLQLRVQQAQRLESLGTLAGGVAHDFNNILMGVLGNAELALSRLAPTEPVRGDIKEIVRAARRAAELANQMLDYSGRGHFLTERINLSEVAASVASLIEASVPKTTDLRFDLDGRLPPVDGNKTQIRQIIMNFVLNASEALESQDGVIRVSTGTMQLDGMSAGGTELDGAGPPGTDLETDLADGLYVYVEVADTGSGMDAETSHRIFEPFFSTKFTGRGLGLAAVHGIVRGHRGGVRVDSRPGEGTTIRAFFPVPEFSRESEDHPVAVGRRNTILLVDDEVVVRTTAKRMLLSAGYRVRLASDGLEAVEVFSAHSSELACVVLDLTMPRMGGEEAFLEFRKISEEVPVVLSSGYTAEDIEGRVSTEGLAGFLKKPYSMRQLLGLVGSIALLDR